MCVSVCACVPAYARVFTFVRVRVRVRVCAGVLEKHYSGAELEEVKDELNKVFHRYLYYYYLKVLNCVYFHVTVRGV